MSSVTTSTVGPSATQSPSSLLTKEPSTFLKIFLNIIYYEPFVLEMFVGALLILIPNTKFVLSSIMSSPLVDMMISEKIATPDPLTSFPIAVSIGVQNVIFFLIRFCGLMLVVFGVLHHLLLRHCFKELAFEDISFLSSKTPLFHLTICGLAFGDVLHIAVTWAYCLFYSVPTVWDEWESLIQVILPTFISVLLCVLRIWFMLSYDTFKVIGVTERTLPRRLHVE